jgi:hypothetical protein
VSQGYQCAKLPLGSANMVAKKKEKENEIEKRFRIEDRILI